MGLEVQKERHQNFMRGESDFFNPWQYRVFSPFLLEGFIRSWETVSSPFAYKLPYKEMQQFFPYFLLRFIQNLLIFFAAFRFYKALIINSNLLKLMGILLLGYNMSNSNYASDLSFNTYFDILFYLVAGFLILEKKYVWLIPVSFVAALNRETSAFIPLMFLILSLNLKKIELPDKKVLIIFFTCIALFLIAYTVPRFYYGMRQYHGINNLDTPLEFLKFNIGFGSLYPELFGTLGFTFLLVILRFNRLSRELKLFFLLIVPAWFMIHFFKSQAMETRLFLVPQALIFIPSLLYLIEREIKSSRLRGDLL